VHLAADCCISSLLAAAVQRVRRQFHSVQFSFHDRRRSATLRPSVPPTSGIKNLQQHVRCKWKRPEARLELAAGGHKGKRRRRITSFVCRLADISYVRWHSIERGGGMNGSSGCQKSPKDRCRRDAIASAAISSWQDFSPDRCS